MARFKLNPVLVKALVPLVLPELKALAARTANTLDDRVVNALEATVSNPVLFALLLSLLASETPEVPVSKSPGLSALESGLAEVLEENADIVRGLFAVAKDA